MRSWRSRSGGESQLTYIYFPLGGIASHNYWETICKWQMYEHLQGWETHWFLPLAKNPFFPGLGTPYLSSFSPSLLLPFLLFCVSLQFHFSHFICCSQGSHCLLSTLMKSLSILQCSLRTKWESLEQGSSSALRKGEIIASLLPLYSV